MISESIINELKQLQEQYAEGLITEQELKDRTIVFIGDLNGNQIFDIIVLATSHYSEING